MSFRTTCWLKANLFKHCAPTSATQGCWKLEQGALHSACPLSPTLSPGHCPSLGFLFMELSQELREELRGLAISLNFKTLLTICNDKQRKVKVFTFRKQSHSQGCMRQDEVTYLSYVTVPENILHNPTNPGIDPPFKRLGVI